MSFGILSTHRSWVRIAAVANGLLHINHLRSVTRWIEDITFHQLNAMHDTLITGCITVVHGYIQSKVTRPIFTFHLIASLYLLDADDQQVFIWLNQTPYFSNIQIGGPTVYHSYVRRCYVRRIMMIRDMIFSSSSSTFCSLTSWSQSLFIYIYNNYLHLESSVMNTLSKHFVCFSSFFLGVSNLNYKYYSLSLFFSANISAWDEGWWEVKIMWKLGWERIKEWWKRGEMNELKLLWFPSWTFYFHQSWSSSCQRDMSHQITQSDVQILFNYYYSEHSFWG